MKWRTIFLVLTILFGLAVGFWLYGLGRTMRESVNFNTTAFLSGMVLSMGIPLVVFVPLCLAKRIWFDEKILSMPLFLIVFTASLFVSSLFSEAWILRDEARFSVEARKANTLYHRARAWPNQMCSLVFVPGRGIHSTD